MTRFFTAYTKKGSDCYLIKFKGRYYKFPMSMSIDWACDRIKHGNIISCAKPDGFKYECRVMRTRLSNG